MIKRIKLNVKKKDKVERKVRIMKRIRNDEKESE